ncbi:leucine-rich repeat-containing protein 74B [Lingula anatina]|uniref:Leucine-rich repeat-containing protein 74B n=1 Tax=Lingula anatina TaxID=7574 RepID=A0A1S3JZ69_LINAN|nr:leucine-rich repeat-containing protein 74B [Lingula anatina]|eukprot:XP_013415374.1 leucine-rich repeat-containing protein 74B [Lingula anatina]
MEQPDDAVAEVKAKREHTFRSRMHERTLTNLTTSRITPIKRPEIPAHTYNGVPPPDSPDVAISDQEMLQFMYSEASFDLIRNDTGDALDGKKETEIETKFEEDYEYDTDLETPDSRCESTFDQWGKATYLAACKRLRVVPVQSVLSHLEATELVVKHRTLSEKEAKAIAEALLVNTTVTHLDLSGNNLSAGGLAHLAPMLRENLNIRSLNLSGNLFGTEGLKSLSMALLVNQNITVLSLSGTHLADEHATYIANLLQDVKTLVELDLSHNNMGESAANIIGASLANNDALRILNLGWNNFRPKGSAAIFQGLTDNVMLKTFIYSMNGVAEAASAVAATIKHNVSLKELDLTSTRLFDNGVVKICKSLESNEHLEILKMGYNTITTLGGLAVLKALLKNEHSALKCVDLSRVYVHKDCIMMVEKIRETNPSFQFKIDGILKSDRYYGDEKKGRSQPIISSSPIDILRWFMESKSFRLIDLFKHLDKDGSMSVTREEFIMGLKAVDVPMTTAQLDELVNMLDKDKDGEVDFKELIDGQKEGRRQGRKN